MSCSGKTTFAALTGHPYYCFDAMFHWHLVETFGLSAAENLAHVRDACVGPRFVLDGWHLSDPDGLLMPDARRYVVYAAYDRIISQYRVPAERGDHVGMYRKWYRRYVNARYFLNAGDFIETGEEEYLRAVGLQADSALTS